MLFNALKIKIVIFFKLELKGSSALWIAWALPSLRGLRVSTGETVVLVRALFFCVHHFFFWFLCPSDPACFFFQTLFQVSGSLISHFFPWKLIDVFLFYMYMCGFDIYHTHTYVYITNTYLYTCISVQQSSFKGFCSSQLFHGIEIICLKALAAKIITAEFPWKYSLICFYFLRVIIFPHFLFFSPVILITCIFYKIELLSRHFNLLGFFHFNSNLILKM